jgi:hypothetical protein
MENSTTYVGLDVQILTDRAERHARSCGVMRVSARAKGYAGSPLQFKGEQHRSRHAVTTENTRNLQSTAPLDQTYPRLRQVLSAESRVREPFKRPDQAIARMTGPFGRSALDGTGSLK